jgi:hypothetical protein
VEDDDSSLVGSWRCNQACGVTVVDSSRYHWTAYAWGMAFTPTDDRPLTRSSTAAVSDSSAAATTADAGEVPFVVPTAALRNSIMFTNGETLAVYHPISDWVSGNPGYGGLYQVCIAFVFLPERFSLLR